MLNLLPYLTSTYLTVILIIVPGICTTAPSLMITMLEFCFNYYSVV